MSVSISYSASNKYQSSPRAWYLHYVRRLRSNMIGSPLIFGSAVDDALNALLLGEDAQYAFLKAWQTTEFNGEKVHLMKSEKVKYSKADYDPFIFTEEDDKLVESGANINWVSLRRKGLRIIEAYKEQVMPHIKEVIAVQKKVFITNDDGDKFVGFIDFIARWEDDRVVLFDNKTTSIKYKPNSAGESEQLATYYDLIDDIKIDAVGYIAIAKKFRKRKEPLIPIDVIIDNVDEALIEKTFQIYDNTLHGIKMGNFECTGCNDTPWGCGYEKFCASNGEDMTGLIYVPERKKK